MRAVVVAVVLAGCGFEGAMGSADGADDTLPTDDDPDADADDDPPEIDAAPRLLTALMQTWSTSIEEESVAVLFPGDSTAELVVLAVATKPYVEPIAVAGGGDWNFVGTQCGPRGQTGVTLYTRTTAGPSGAVTVQFDDTVRAAVMVIAEYAGASNVAGVLTESMVPDSCDEEGGDVASYSFDFPAGQGRAVVAAVATRQYGHTPAEPGIQRGHGLAQPGNDGDIAGLALVDGLAFDPVAGELTAPSDVAVVAIAVE